MVNLTINNKKICAAEEMTILEAAKQNNILIPHFCSMEGIHQIGSCRICVVEVEGEKTLQASCKIRVKEGMVVYTNTEKVKKARKLLYELMLSDHPKDCLNCTRNQNCEFQRLGEIIQVSESRFEGEKSKPDRDDSSPSIVRDTAKCILCRRCVTVCNDVQEIGVLNVQKRGFHSFVGPAAGLPLNSVNCTYCGQCINVCPVGALQEKDSTQMVWNALYDRNKRVIVQTAPSVRVSLGEEFGYEPGTVVTGKMVTALRDIGFNDVFDTSFGADLTVLEESHELLKRIKNSFLAKQAALPMITSCSPGWIKYFEHVFPERLEHLSTCKSPHMMLGALIKTYYADKIKVNPKDIFVVSVMPCTAKKFEITRPELKNNGFPNVDAVLTTRELARMIKEAGIDFRNLEEGEFDTPLGISAGAGNLFGAAGGVAEAVLRTVYRTVTGRELQPGMVHIRSIKGQEHIKALEVKIENTVEEYRFIDGETLKVAAASGMKGMKAFMEQLEDGTSPYHFIEVMGCPGGCINGGGQPRPSNEYVRKKRMEAVHSIDRGKALRGSHENPAIAKLYEEFLAEPLGKKSGELLHTKYTKRGIYNELI
ncbi:MAG: NADH-dependent [FeFe] hydrogenase, group A6 [Clostridiales bacterium]|nr:NADH-dependent [FeFe] hydrogenase, group A6 [Eubacteriales bacterium]MDH7565432.1 NADH-dependent [FeFe] hydrogenase, group A6 [Clostridiales bacterium]